MNNSVDFFNSFRSNRKSFQHWNHFPFQIFISKFRTENWLFIMNFTLILHYSPCNQSSFRVFLPFDLFIFYNKFPKSEEHFFSVNRKLALDFIQNPLFLSFSYFSDWFENSQQNLQSFSLKQSFHICFSYDPRSSFQKCIHSFEFNLSVIKLYSCFFFTFLFSLHVNMLSKPNEDFSLFLGVLTFCD